MHFGFLMLHWDYGTYKAFPSDVNDKEWAFVAPYVTLMTEDAPQRAHALRDVFNGLRWIVRAGAGPDRSLLCGGPLRDVRYTAAGARLLRMRAATAAGPSYSSQQRTAAPGVRLADAAQAAPWVPGTRRVPVGRL